MGVEIFKKLQSYPPPLQLSTTEYIFYKLHFEPLRWLTGSFKKARRDSCRISPAAYWNWRKDFGISLQKSPTALMQKKTKCLKFLNTIICVEVYHFIYAEIMACLYSFSKKDKK